MKKIILLFILILFAINICFGQNGGVDFPEIIKIEADPKNGFAYPYYLFVPKAMREAEAQKQTQTILVIPNNTGKNDDDLSVHEEEVKRRIAQNGTIGAQMKIAVLMPVFPRPKTDWKIYTHALDRDALLTGKKEYSRFDLQLLAMIDDARERLGREKIKTDRKVLITGFSASGMFANRFTFLHPERVKAAAIGSPGGWAIAPATEFKEKSLRYPIGTADYKTVSGKNFDIKNLRNVPMFIFLGDQDDNDSLVFTDGYDTEDKDLVFELFGKTPVERWEISKKLYQESKLNVEFKLYPNVKHTVNREIMDDIMAFFSKYK